MKHRILFFCFLSCVSVKAASYNLEQALDEALKQEPTLLQKREKVHETDATLRKSWSLLAPSLDFNASAMVQKDALASSSSHAGRTYDAYKTEFALTQPLLRGNALWTELQRGAIELESRKFDVALAERDVEARTIRAFYALLLAETLQSSYLEQQKILQETLQTAENRWRVGNERELSVLQIRTELALLRPKITEATQNRHSTALDLAYLIGAPASSDEIHLEGKLTPPDWSRLSSALRNEAAHQKLEIHRQQLALDEFEKARQVSLSAHWPALSATAGLGRDGSKLGQLWDSDNTHWYAGLQLKIPLFSGLSSFRDREILASQEAALRIQKKETESQAATELQRADKGLEESRDSVNALQSALELANQAVTLAKKQYSLGTASYTQLSDAQNNLLQAELTLDQTRHTYINRMVDYFVAAGWPLERLAAGLGGRVPAGD